MKIPHRKIFCWVVLATFLLTTNDSYPQSPDSEVIENANKEGNVVWYTTMNLATSKEIVNRFHKKYPSIKPELMRTGGGILLNRILTEARGGRYAWDVALGRGEKERIFHLFTPTFGHNKKSRKNHRIFIAVPKDRIRAVDDSSPSTATNKKFPDRSSPTYLSSKENVVERFPSPPIAIALPAS